MGTIGGGLVNGDPSQDPPPTLIALGASAVITSKKGDRVVPVEELFIDYYERMADEETRFVMRSFTLR